jgi:oligoendopeptidase F
MLPVKQVLAEISSLPYHRLNQTNISEISLSPNGDLFFVTSEEEVEVLKGNLKDNEEIIKGLEKENTEKDQELGKLEEELAKLEEVDNIRDGELSLADLLVEKQKTDEQNLEFRKALQGWKSEFEKQTRELEKLRARKDKAKVHRSLHTGKLIAEFAGKKYYLETEIPAEKA